MSELTKISSPLIDAIYSQAQPSQLIDLGRVTVQFEYIDQCASNLTRYMADSAAYSSQWLLACRVPCAGVNKGDV